MWRLTGDLWERATACLWKGDSRGVRHRSNRNALTLQVVARATVLVQYAATHCMRRQQPCTCLYLHQHGSLEDVACVSAERTSPCLSGCRCRYLEETGCVSVCVNSCKLPTQVAGTPHHLALCPSFDASRCMVHHVINGTHQQLKAAHARMLASSGTTPQLAM